MKEERMDNKNTTNNYNPNWDANKYYGGRQTVGALFQNRNQAEDAINALKARGFRGDQIGIAMRDRDAKGQLIADTGSKAAEGATTGAVSGGVLGGIVGFLVGVGALVIPGVGPIISAGVLTAAFGTAGATALAGAGIGAATGGVVGGLIGLGIPETEAKYFDTGIRAGRVLVTVNAAGRISEVVSVLQEYGGDLGVDMNAPMKTTTTTTTTVR